MTLSTEATTDHPTAEQQIEIERTCTRLILEAAACTDRRDFVELAQLFQTEGRLFRPTDPANPLVGREAILNSYQARPSTRMTRHFCTNIIVTPESAQRARALCYVQVLTADTERGPEGASGYRANEKIMIGEFEDVFAKTQGQWLFAERHARFVMHCVS